MTSDHEDPGGVLVLRVWIGPGDGVIGRVQWSTAGDDDGTDMGDVSILGSSSAILREVRAFLHRVEHENQIAGPRDSRG